MSTTIDINVEKIIYDVVIEATPNEYIINVNNVSGGGTTPNLPQVLERGDRPYKAIPANYPFELGDITKWIYAAEGGVNTLDDTDDLFLVGCSIPIVVDIQTFEFKAVGTVVYSNLLPSDTPLDTGSLFLYKGDSAELKKISSGAWYLQVTRFNETAFLEYRALFNQAGTDTPTVTVLQNTLGFEPTFQRDDIGVYYIEQPFDITKTTYIVQNNSGATATDIRGAINPSGGLFYVLSSQSGVYIDDVCQNVPITILIKK